MVLAGGEHDDGDLRVAKHVELLGLPWINTVCALMVGLVELHKINLQHSECCNLAQQC
jgi:hypothetical protein